MDAARLRVEFSFVVGVMRLHRSHGQMIRRVRWREQNFRLSSGPKMIR
jgi:hypothetical protein